jgi:uncharacterized membrane protein
MHTLVSVVLPDRDAALAALSALRSLESRGVRAETVYMIGKAEDGTVLEEDAEDDFPPPSGTIAGLVVGGLMGGLFRWPGGAAIGAGIGALFGLFRDWYESQSHQDFTVEVGRILNRGQYAVIVETKQDTSAVLDVEMQQLGGVVSRMAKPAAIRIHASLWAKQLTTDIDARIAARWRALPGRWGDIKAKAQASTRHLREP